MQRNAAACTAFSSREAADNTSSSNSSGAQSSAAAGSHNWSRTRAAVVAGLVSGTAAAGTLTPWDRALYLSVTHRRPFLTAANFHHPYEGFGQTVVQRIVSGGLYFCLVAVFTDMSKTLLGAEPTSTATAAGVGIAAGAINGMVLNQLATVKYHVWNTRTMQNFWSAAHSMAKAGGLPAFTRGIWATGSRDVVFGLCYEVGRTYLRKSWGVSYTMSNLVAGSLATVMSGPLNYIRNIQYATPPDMPAVGIVKGLKQLLQEARSMPTRREGLKFLQQRLRIGWGSARVVVGMVIGQYVFDEVMHRWQHTEEQLLTPAKA